MNTYISNYCKDLSLLLAAVRQLPDEPTSRDVIHLGIIEAALPTRAVQDLYRDHAAPEPEPEPQTSAGDCR